jgi:very-short-patch-repair endonuclease
VADSALRHGVDGDELRRVAAVVRGPGAANVRKVVAAADGRAANPFESALRALAIEAGCDVEPQVELDTMIGVVRPDLVDRSRRVVIEADSWSWHAKHEHQHERDCQRYNALVVAGWRVLRFTHAQVIDDPDGVRAMLGRLTDGAA